jgi:hypothetical protein
VNALQQLIADYLADNPGETYSSIARRGELPRQTVHALAKKAAPRQTPHPDTIAGLARGLQVSEEVVRRAAGEAAGYGKTVTTEHLSAHGRTIVESASQLDPERQEALARRARALLREMQEEREAASRKGKGRAGE